MVRGPGDLRSGWPSAVSWPRASARPARRGIPRPFPPSPWAASSSSRTAPRAPSPCITSRSSCGTGTSARRTTSWARASRTPKGASPSAMTPRMRVKETCRTWSSASSSPSTRSARMAGWWRRWRRIGSERGPDDHGGLQHDFGTLRLPYWEYDPATPLARLLVVEEGTPPTAYAPGRSLAMLKAVAPIELIKRQHLLQGRLGQAPSLAKIQADYPESTTVRMERESPGSTRSDAYLRRTPAQRHVLHHPGPRPRGRPGMRRPSGSTCPGTPMSRTASTACPTWTCGCGWWRAGCCPCASSWGCGSPERRRPAHP